MTTEAGTRASEMSLLDSVTVMAAEVAPERDTQAVEVVTPEGTPVSRKAAGVIARASEGDSTDVGAGVAVRAGVAAGKGADVGKGVAVGAGLEPPPGRLMTTVAVVAAAPSLTE